MSQLSQNALYLDSHLTNYYKLDDLTDSKGTNNLTNNGSVTFTTGAFGNAADGGTNNTTKYLSTSTPWLTNSGITSDWTICFWFYLYSYPSTGNSYTLLMNEGDGSGPYNARSFSIVVDSGGHLTWTGYPNNLTQDFSMGASAAVNTGSWNHCAVTFTTGSQVLYINGVQVATASVTWGTDTNNYGGHSESSILANQVSISLSNPGNYTNGKIDDLAVFSRVLTASEVAGLNARFPGAMI